MLGRWLNRSPGGGPPRGITEGLIGSIPVVKALATRHRTIFLPEMFDEVTFELAGCNAKVPESLQIYWTVQYLFIFESS